MIRLHLHVSQLKFHPIKFQAKKHAWDFFPCYNQNSACAAWISLTVNTSYMYLCLKMFSFYLDIKAQRQKLCKQEVDGYQTLGSILLAKVIVSNFTGLPKIQFSKEISPEYHIITGQLWNIATKVLRVKLFRKRYMFQQFYMYQELILALKIFRYILQLLAVFSCIQHKLAQIEGLPPDILST